MNYLKKEQYRQWQYNGVAEWIDIINWCYNNLGGRPGHRLRSDWSGRWSVDWETIYFESEEDYTLFLLRWS